MLRHRDLPGAGVSGREGNGKVKPIGIQFQAIEDYLQAPVLRDPPSSWTHHPCRCAMEVSQGIRRCVSNRSPTLHIAMIGVLLVP